MQSSEASYITSSHCNCSDIGVEVEKAKYLHLGAKAGKVSSNSLLGDPRNNCAKC